MSGHAEEGERLHHGGADARQLLPLPPKRQKGKVTAAARRSTVAECVGRSVER